MFKIKKDKKELNKIKKQRPWDKEKIHTTKNLFNKNKEL